MSNEWYFCEWSGEKCGLNPEDHHFRESYLFFDKNVIFCMKHVLFLQAVFVGMRVAHSWQLSYDPSL